MNRKKLKNVLSLFITVLFTQINYAQTVTIGKQVWMTNNLNVDKFRNGDPIPEAKTNAEWVEAGKKKQPAWCYYDNDPSNGTKYGKLYNWYAVNDSRGLAPKGYHIPTNKDWGILTEYLGGEYGELFAGKKMKSTSGWKDNGNGTNSSGFSGLPGGFRDIDGTFFDVDKNGSWWSSTKYEVFITWIYINTDYDSIIYEDDYDKEAKGFSVRCLRD